MMPILFAAALFFQCYALVAAAIPMNKGDDGGISSSEQDALSSLLLGEEATEHSMAVVGDDPPIVVSRSGGPRVIVMMADAAVLKNLRALGRGLSLYKQQQQQRAGDNVLPLERRELALELEPNMALLKRETMRCMVGRVYRPCWEA